MFNRKSRVALGDDLEVQYGPIHTLLAIAILAGLSTTVLVGWFLNWPILIQIHPQWVPMQFNTAICFLLLSFCIALSSWPLIKYSYISLILLLLSSSTLLQYFLNIDFGIDEFFMQHYITLHTSHPGRMAPNTAVSFILSGVYFLCISFRTTRPWQWLISTFSAAIILGLACIAIFGYLTRLEGAYAWGLNTKMAMHTAIGFLTFSLWALIFSFLHSEKQLDRSNWINICLSIFITTFTICSLIALNAHHAKKHNAQLKSYQQLVAKEVKNQLDLTIEFNQQLNYEISNNESFDKTHLTKYFNRWSKLTDALSGVIITNDSGILMTVEKTGEDMLYYKRYQLSSLLTRADSLKESSFRSLILPKSIFEKSYLIVYSEYLIKGHKTWLAVLLDLDSLQSQLGSSYSLTNISFSMDSLSNNDLDQSSTVIFHSALSKELFVKFEFVSTEIDEYRLLVVALALLAFLIMALFWIVQKNYYSRRHQNRYQQVFTEQQSVLDTMIDGLVVINHEGIITNVNQAIIDMFGYKKLELIGQNIKCLMQAEIAKNHDHYLKRYYSTREPRILGGKRELVAKHKSGNAFPILLQVTEFYVNNTLYFTGVIHDCSKSVNTSKKLIQTESILQTAMHSSPAGMAIENPQGYFIEVNAALAHWLGYSVNEMKGMSVVDIAPLSERETTRDSLDKMACGTIESVNKEKQYLRKNGELVWGVLSASTVKDQEGKVIVIVAQIIDVDEQKKMAITLEGRNKELSKTNQELDQFAYIASHDLKSPLNAIIKLASWIKDDCESVLQESSKSHLSLMVSRTKRMAKLLDDLLLYSRAGRIAYDAKEQSLQSTVEDVIMLVNLPTGFTYRTNDLSFFLPVVPFELVLRNLISNAVKHHDRESGKIIIHGELAEDSYHFTVADDGPGIPSTLHKKALEMFQTLKSRDEVEGSGMGLALCKKTVEHYGGNLSIESENARGTIIHFYWPKALDT